MPLSSDGTSEQNVETTAQHYIETLEKVARWATKVVSGLGKLPFIESLKRLNLAILKT